MVAIPSLTLSSGPAVSGAPNSAGPAATGLFVFGGSVPGKGGIAKFLPYIAIAGAVWWFMRRK